VQPVALFLEALQMLPSEPGALSTPWERMLLVSWPAETWTEFHGNSAQKGELDRISADQSEFPPKGTDSARIGRNWSRFRKRPSPGGGSPARSEDGLQANE